jgi:hypothetical protein
MRYILLKFLSALLFVYSGLHAQEPIQKWIPAYEKEMVEAVKSWTNKQYGSALDHMRSARELIAQNIPSPSDSYYWHASCSMKTYALLLIRLVELDIDEQEGKTESTHRTVRQVLEWGEKLKEQARDWASIKVESPSAQQLRETWLRRYLGALNRVKTLPQNFDAAKADS